MELKRNKHLHSKEHVLANDLSRLMGEPKRFASYLGIAKLYEERELRALARYVAEKKDLQYEARGKYFFGALRRMPKKQGVTFRPRRGKKKKKIHARNPRRSKRAA